MATVREILTMAAPPMAGSVPVPSAAGQGTTVREILSRSVAPSPRPRPPGAIPAEMESLVPVPSALDLPPIGPPSQLAFPGTPEPPPYGELREASLRGQREAYGLIPGVLRIVEKGLRATPEMWQEATIPLSESAGKSAQYWEDELARLFPVTRRADESFLLRHGVPEAAGQLASIFALGAATGAAGISGTPASMTVLGAFEALKKALEPSSTIQDIAAAGGTGAAAGGILRAVTSIPALRPLGLSPLQQERAARGMFVKPPVSISRAAYETYVPKVLRERIAFGPARTRLPVPRGMTPEKAIERAAELKRIDIVKQRVKAARAAGQPIPADILKEFVFGRAGEAGAFEPAKFIDAAAKIGINADTAQKVFAELGKQGGDVAKAALAVGLQEAVARHLAARMAVETLTPDQMRMIAERGSSSRAAFKGPGAEAMRLSGMDASKADHRAIMLKTLQDALQAPTVPGGVPTPIEAPKPVAGRVEALQPPTEVPTAAEAETWLAGFGIKTVPRGEEALHNLAIGVRQQGGRITAAQLAKTDVVESGKASLAEATKYLQDNGMTVEAPAAPAAAKPGVKQPWEMTWDEYRSPEVGGSLGKFEASIEAAARSGKPVNEKNLHFLTTRLLKELGGVGKTSVELAESLAKKLASAQAKPARPEPSKPPAVEGLWGQETAKIVQKPLWDKRGVEAVWRTVNGVAYVKVSEGRVATRADGTGPSIPLDEPDFEQRLKADAAKAKPPAAPTIPAAKPATPEAMPQEKMPPADLLAEAKTQFDKVSDLDVMKVYVFHQEDRRAAAELHRRGLLYTDDKGYWQNTEKGAPIWEEAANAYARREPPPKIPPAPAAPVAAAPTPPPAVTPPKPAKAKVPVKAAAPKKPPVPVKKVVAKPLKAPVAKPPAEPVKPAGRAVYVRTETGALGEPTDLYRIEGNKVLAERLGDAEGLAPKEVLEGTGIKMVGEPPAKPPAPPPVAEAKKPTEPERVWTPESRRVEAYMDRRTTSQAVRLAKQAKEPGQPSIASVPAVKKAIQSDQPLARHEKDLIKKAMGIVKEAIPAVSETPLVDWTSPNRGIAAWPGQELATEINEATEEWPEARAYFSFKPNKNAAPIDNVVTSAMEDVTSGFKGDTPSQFLDQLLAELETREQAKLVQASGLIGRLEKAAQGMRPEEAAEAKSLAEALREVGADRELVRKSILSAMKPYLLTEQGTETVLGRKVRELQERLGQAEVTEAALAERTAELKSVRMEAAFLAEEVRIKGEVRDEMVRSVNALLDRAALSETARKRIFPFLEKVTTPAQMLRIMERADQAFEKQLKEAAYARAERAAKHLRLHRREFDPKNPDTISLMSEATSALSGKRAVMSRDLDSLEELADRLEVAWHEHRTREEMMASRKEEKVGDLATGIAGSVPQRPGLVAARPGEQPQARDVGTGEKAFVHFAKPWTLLRLYMGQEGSAVHDILYDVPVLEGGRTYAIERNKVNDNWKALAKAAGFEAATVKYTDWLRGMVKAPGLPPMERRFLVTVLGMLRDGQTVRAFPLVGFNLSTDRTGPRIDLSAEGIGTLQAWVKENEPKLVPLVDEAYAWYNRSEHFNRMSEIEKARSGRYIMPLKEYWPSPKNVALEIPPVPFVSPWDIARQGTLGHHIERVTPPFKSPLLVEPFDEVYFRQSNTDAGYLAYTLAHRDAIAVLNAQISTGRPDETISLERLLERRVGRSVMREIRANLSDLLHNTGLATGGGAEPYSLMQDLAKRTLLRMGEAVTWINPRMFVRQVMGALAGWSDAKAPPTKYWLRAYAKVAANPRAAMREVMEKVPEVRFRVEGGMVYNYITGGTIGPRPLSPRKLLRDMQVVGAKHGPMFLRVGDLLGQAVRYFTFYDFNYDQGLRGAELEEKATRATARLMTQMDFPSTPGNIAGGERAARSNVFMAALTWFRITRNAVMNQFYEQVHGLGKALRTGGDPRPILTRMVKLMFAALAMAGVGTVGIGLLSQKKVRTVAGFTEESGWAVLDSSLGNMPLVGQALSSIRYARGGRAQVEMAPFGRTLEDMLGGTMGLMKAIGGADVKQAGRSASRLSYAMAMMLGVPVVGPRNVWSVLKSFALEEVKKPKKAGRGKDFGALVWRASEAGAKPETLRALKASGISLVEARRLLREELAARGVSPREGMARMKMLIKAWMASQREAA